MYFKSQLYTISTILCDLAIRQRLTLFQGIFQAEEDGRLFSGRSVQHFSIANSAQSLLKTHVVHFESCRLCP